MLAFVTRKVFELTANVSLVWVFFNHPDQRHIKAARYRGVVCACALYFSITVLAQSFTFRQYQFPPDDEWFPFTRWAMFTGGAATSSVIADFAWQGISASGGSVLVNPAVLVPTVNAVAHFTKTTKLAEHLQANTKDRVECGRKLVAPYATGLLRRYNMLHPDDPLVGLVLWYRPIPIAKGTVVPDYFEEETGKRIWDSRNTLP
jgi:hypothetical protein